MHFVWFWTFWHWSRESCQAGRLLRSPLQGIGSHWDEWFRHEASEKDLKAIEEAGRSEVSQRQFIRWLVRHWAPEMDIREYRMIPRFVLGQLAQVPPFKAWPGFGQYGRKCGAAGVSAIVLAEESRGEPEDVRKIEALILPAEVDDPRIEPEGFQATAAELDAPRSAAMSLLAGKKLRQFLLLWIAGGRRPYPRWLRLVLSLGWAGVAGLILFLLLGPEPGEQLVPICAMLAGLWCILLLVATGTVVRESLRAWRLGRRLKSRLECSQVRLRMNGGMDRATAAIP